MPDPIEQMRRKYVDFLLDKIRECGPDAPAELFDRVERVLDAPLRQPRPPAAAPRPAAGSAATLTGRPAFVLHAEGMSSQADNSAVLKVYPVRLANFSCRVGVGSDLGRGKLAEILLTSAQLRELATDLQARADILDASVSPADVVGDETDPWDPRFVERDPWVLSETAPTVPREAPCDEAD